MTAYQIQSGTVGASYVEIELKEGGTYKQVYEASTGATFYRTLGSGAMPTDFPSGFYASEKQHELGGKLTFVQGAARYTFVDSAGGVWVGYVM